jgi:hypothetical protein
VFSLDERFAMFFLINLLLLSADAAPAAAVPGDQAAPRVVVVCAAEFRPALKPWEELRRQQGCSLEFVSPEQITRLQATLEKLHRQKPITHMVLVGDVDAHHPKTARNIGVPAFQVPAKVNVHFGSEPQIATDAPFVDFNADQIPDAAVGRLSVDTPEQLTVLVRKILQYETDNNFGPWRQRISLVAGVGGFGSLIDGTLESTAKQFLRDGVPAGYATSMTYGSWQSPYCPNPAQFQQSVLKQFNSGSLFWVYIGHGHPERLDRLHVPGAAYPILDRRDVTKLRCEHGSPIAVLLSCYTGAYDLPQDCFAEELLRTPGGPVAVLAGSRVTMPYAMTRLSYELLDEAFSHRVPTLGEIVLVAKRKSVQAPVAGDTAAGKTEAPVSDRAEVVDNRQWIDTIGKILSPKADLLDAERLEHVALFNLLGDPLLRIAYPQPIKLELPEETRAGEMLPLQITSTVAGKGTLQLVCRRDCLTFVPPVRSEFGSTAPEAQQQIYERSNDHRFLEHSITLQPGKFAADLVVPPEAQGHCQVRVFIEGDKQHALGGSDVYVRPAKNVSTARK